MSNSGILVLTKESNFKQRWEDTVQNTDGYGVPSVPLQKLTN